MLNADIYSLVGDTAALNSARTERKYSGGGETIGFGREQTLLLSGGLNLTATVVFLEGADDLHLVEVGVLQYV